MLKCNRVNLKMVNFQVSHQLLHKCSDDGKVIFVWKNINVNREFNWCFRPAIGLWSILKHISNDSCWWILLQLCSYVQYIHFVWHSKIIYINLCCVDCHIISFARLNKALQGNNVTVEGMLISVQFFRNELENIRS